VLDLEPWQVLQTETVFDHAPWLRVVRQAVRLANGHVIPDYLLTPGRDYSLIVARTDAGEILLVQQYKHGLGRVVFDFPAGYLDTPDEDPLACAQRELREETGYSARHWTALGHYAMDSNRATSGAYLFAAQGLTRVAEPKLDDTEALRALSRPAAEIPALLASGAMPTLACAAAWGLAAGVLFNSS
jgi:ADP-ribose pyrophosphatase